MEVLAHERTLMLAIVADLPFPSLVSSQHNSSLVVICVSQPGCPGECEHTYLPTLLLIRLVSFVQMLNLDRSLQVCGRLCFEGWPPNSLSSTGS